MEKQNLKISSLTLTSALGQGMAAHAQALQTSAGGLRRCDLSGVDLDTWIGRVDGVEDFALSTRLAEYDCRNNRLAEIGLRQDGFKDAVDAAVVHYGATRVGVFIGTSTAGVQQTEMAYARRDASGQLPQDFIYQTTQNPYSVGDYVRQSLGLQGVAQVVSTACSSSAKVFATAMRFMRAGLCDAAVVGGVDSLCEMTLYGFHALQLVSKQPCRPADQDRDGINIGEAAGFALLEWSADATDLCVLGVGESSDAYHMSAPHIDGDGAFLAMQQALSQAQLETTAIDFIHLHGTATPANDLAEDKAVHRLFAGHVPCASSKGFTGHTLGAAGIINIGFAALAIDNQFLPGSLNTVRIDEKLRSPVVLQPTPGEVSRVMCNAFGFGGSNASVIIGRRAL